MSLFRRRRPRVHVPFDEGCHAAEAPALQRGIVQALGHDARAGRMVPAELEVVRGREGRLALVWRQAFVGFVPADRVDELRGRLDALDRRAVALVPGAVLPMPDPAAADAPWRVWIGPVPDAIPSVPEGLDTLAVPERTILGVPVSKLRAPG